MYANYGSVNSDTVGLAFYNRSESTEELIKTVDNLTISRTHTAYTMKSSSVKIPFRPGYPTIVRLNSSTVEGPII